MLRVLNSTLPSRVGVWVPMMAAPRAGAPPQLFGVPSLGVPRPTSVLRCLPGCNLDAISDGAGFRAPTTQRKWTPLLGLHPTTNICYQYRMGRSCMSSCHHRQVRLRPKRRFSVWQFSIRQFTCGYRFCQSVCCYWSSAAAELHSGRRQAQLHAYAQGTPCGVILDY